ncbi:MAG: RNA methyltransferase [Holophagaceae bacterium]|nr:RNA methyltransferase [Holophagaceae bacterium]
MNIDIRATDLIPYQGLHGGGVANHPDIGSCFICEGRFLVEDAIKASMQGHLRIISLLCNANQQGEWETKIPHQTRLISLDSSKLDTLVGFQFHRGVLCCCEIPREPTEATIIQSKRLLVLPQIENVDNLGQLIRTATGLGVSAILLGKGPSPFTRKCVRVSMGAIWKIPIYKTENLGQILDMWLQRFPDNTAEIVGTAVTDNAESAWQWQPKPMSALVLGSESYGLDDTWRRKCNRHVRIPMTDQVDSLNLSAAGAILMSKLFC